MIKNRTAAMLTVLTLGLLVATNNVLSVVAQNSMPQEILNAHNQYRGEVGVESLTWSDTLASDAQEWLNYLSSNGLLQHSGTSGQGENLWIGSSGVFSFEQMRGSIVKSSILPMERSQMLVIPVIGLMLVTIINLTHK